MAGCRYTFVPSSTAADIDGRYSAFSCCFDACRPPDILMALHLGGKAINNAADVSAVSLLELLGNRLCLFRIGLQCVSSAVSAVCFEYRILGVSSDNTSSDIRYVVAC